jgi:VanZ family protein
MTGSLTWRHLFAWAPVFAYLGFIFFLSSKSQVPWAEPYPDYLLHACEYGLLAVLVARALDGGLLRPLTNGRLILALILCVAYGASDELHQRFVAGRTCDVRDLAADAAGALIALLALQWLQRRFLSGRVA